MIAWCMMLSGVTSAQSVQGRLQAPAIPVPVQHYQNEYTFDISSDPEKWNHETKGLNVSFATTDALYFRSDVPALDKKAASWETTAWKGERVNVMVLVWSPDTLEQVRIIAGNLKSNAGKVIPAGNIQSRMVRYVVSNYPYNAADVTCGATPYKDIYLMPDRFEQFERFELPGRSVRPVWLSIDIPATVEAGVYQATVKVRSEKEEKVLQLKLTVQNQVLPKPSEWKHRLDLWQNPWVVAWRNQVKPWSDDHMILLKKHMQHYANAGGTFITTYAVHSPWADNSYMIEGGMIEWIRRTNGSWKFDYSIFDQYVQLCMSLGIDEAITVYTPVPWGNRFRYLDEKTGNYIYETWTPDSKNFREFWNVFLTDLKKHLEQKGWLKITYLGINENPMDQTLAAIKVVKDHSPEWRITYAGDWHKELDSLLDDYSYLFGKEPTLEEQKKRAGSGRTSSYYVCCNPAKPNNFVFSPPIEGRWISWYTLAYGYDGFLRWAYDAWPADPERDARHTLWAAGDCFLVYPGGNSGIRFEKLREGIVDFEKITILRQLAAKSKDPAVKKDIQQLEALLQTLPGEKEFKTDQLVATVQKGRELVNALSDKLAGNPAKKAF